MFDLLDRRTEPDGEICRLSTEAQEVAQDLAGLKLLIVNVYMIGNPGARDRSWILVDTGLPYSAEAIRRAAQDRFGRTKPRAIVLTHGHFDHVGSVRELARHWNVPVYAHRLELPFLDGRSSYPPADPTVGGGLVTLLSPLFPTRPIDLGRRLRHLPVTGDVPFAEGWRWIPTPGHSPGHVSLFRSADRTLVAGDAFVTLKQESLIAQFLHKGQVHRPPAYFTIDWLSARQSVRRLAALSPRTVATGHGPVMSGRGMRAELEQLARNFEEAMPRDGRYVRRPARADSEGIQYVPPSVDGGEFLVKLLAGVGIAMAGAAAIGAARKRRHDRGERIEVEVQA